MQKDKKHILLIFNTIISSIAFLVIILHLFFSKNEIVYVDNMKLFDGFNMSKEMKKVGERQFNAQKLKIDSLYFKIQNSNADQQKVLMKEYVVLKQNFEQNNQQFAFEESQKIWKRLNSYINDFSSEKKYKLIIGSEKKGDVLYGDEKLDITNEIINFVNSKYEGAK